MDKVPDIGRVPSLYTGVEVNVKTINDLKADFFDAQNNLAMAFNALVTEIIELNKRIEEGQNRKWDTEMGSAFPKGETRAPD